MDLVIRSGAVALDQRVVRFADGHAARLTALEAALLQFLAERPGIDVSRDELRLEVWGGVASQRTVDHAVARLRKKLREADPPEHIVTSHGRGYRFVPLAVDPVPAPPMRDTVVGLATGRLHLGQRRFERDGRSTSLSALDAALLERLVDGAAVPRAVLVRSIWGVGRHEAALNAALTRLRAKLERDPTAPEVLLTTADRGVRLVLAPQPRGWLPESGSFVPRAEHPLLFDALVHHRLVTVIGTAGIGKTRLAVEVAADWLRAHPVAEVWFCDLARITTAEALVRGVSTRIGAERTGDVRQVGRMIAARPERTLVILDNFEQLVRVGAPVLEAWLGEPAVRILVTSREPLGVPQEHVVPLEPLPLDAGARLFLERAPPHERDPAAVDRLVARLDGLPLAIELAAAIADRDPPAALLERLGARLDLLVLRPEAATSHHSTLRGALDASWRLLDDAERQTLAACSVFEDPFDAASLAAVVDRPSPPLASLFSRSLVRRLGDRWGLFESVREYARERLVLSGAAPATIERHAAHFAQAGAPLVDDLGGPWSAEATERLDRMRADALAALAATQDAGLRGRLGRIVASRGAVNPAATHAALQVALQRGVSDADAAALWLSCANWSWLERRDDRAAAEIARAEALGVADPRLHFKIDLAKAMLSVVRGEHLAALTRLGALSERLTLEPPSPWRLRQRAEIAALRTAANAKLLRVADLAAALAEALPLAEEVGAPKLLGTVLRNAARLESMQGRLDQALRWCDRAVEVARRGGSTQNELMARELRSEVWREMGAFVAADRELTESLPVARLAGRSTEVEAYAACSRAAWAVERRSFDEALQLLPDRTHRGLSGWRDRVAARALCGSGRAEEACVLLSRSPNPDSEIDLAVACALAGRHAEAQEALELARGRPGEWDHPRALGLAEALLRLERCRGELDEPDAPAGAQASLAAGQLRLCDDGVRRERPARSAALRALLELALDRPPATPRSR